MNQTVSEFIQIATHQLQQAGIETARLDSVVLLEDQIRKDRAWILAYPDHPLAQGDVAALSTKLSLREQHIPLAYIRGKVEFYGRTFIVNTHTLVPRPETETMIDMLKRLSLPTRAELLDVGTGSGCIAITAALEVMNSKVYASDIDPNCLVVARQNMAKLHADVTFFENDLLENTPSYDVLLVNLPYVPDNFQINIAATHEPSRALFGGVDGLDLYRKLFGIVKSPEKRPRYILTESLPEQHEKLASIAKAADFALRKTDDFIQLFEYA